VSASTIRRLTPLVTVLIAFAVGGLVVVATGSDPLGVYRSMFVGAGFDWPFQFIPGNPFGVDGASAELNLQSTLVETTPLIFTGLAVAFAFRCGLFNIGGEGQFWMGAAISFLVVDYGPRGPFGVTVAVAAGTLAGMAWGALAGALKAYRGAHEVITTIMLNWIAIKFVGWLFGQDGPFQVADRTSPISDTLPDGAGLPAIWGDLQPVHLGLVLALLCAVLYHVLLNRTTLGYEVRAVGFNPEAARYGGIGVRRSMVLAMGISGAFAGLGGVSEVLGTAHAISPSSVGVAGYGFTGIAVALLGRNTALGVVLGALLFGALDAGARNLTGDFSPDLARSLATVIQGTIILVVGGERVVYWVLERGRRRDRTAGDDAELAPSTPIGGTQS
jgi:simple sugar transport system permease protein